MQFKQKLAYMALGGVLVFMGQLLPSLMGGNATAQKGKEAVEFDTIRARRLEIVDEKGQTYALLEKLDLDVETVIMRVFNRSGHLVCTVGTGGNGSGMLSLHGPDESHLMATSEVIRVSKDNKGSAMMAGMILVSRDKQPLAIMSAHANGGDMRIQEKTGTETIALMSATANNSGIMTVIDQEHKGGVTLTTAEGGGGILVSGKDEGGNEEVQVSISAKKNNGGILVKSGNILVSGKEGGGVVIGVDESGGLVNIWGKGNDEVRASMQVNEYGSGAIGLWDKNGYRLK